jgi:hypothetical protein
MATIPTYETNLPKSPEDAQSAIRVATNPIVGDPGVVVGPPILRPNIEVRTWDGNGNQVGGQGTSDGIPAGADPKSRSIRPQTAQFLFSNTKAEEDLRVTIRVPNGYRNKAYEAGIIFPYTPQITVEHKADFTPQNPLHTNYTLNFYKSSSVSDISIQGLFTVQNDDDAIQYLSAVHLLRALTKGRFGGADPYRGSAPPICRLTAYGDYMLDNAPVSIASFKQDLPSDVDYYYLASSSLGSAMVPTRCTISVVCKLMVSRSEMLTATVPSWLSGVSRKAGLL